MTTTHRTPEALEAALALPGERITKVDADRVDITEVGLPLAPV